MNRAPVFAYTPEQHERIQLGIRKTRVGDSFLVAVTTPRLNRTNDKALWMAARDALDDGAREIVIDLAGCVDVSGHSYGVLVAIANAAKRVSGSVTITNASTDIVALIASHGIEKLFTIRHEVAR